MSDGPASDRPAAVVAQARERVRKFSDPDGAFHVACVETGARPEPVADATFADPDDAAAAADAARTYRAALRAMDPCLPAYDLAVYEGDDRSVEVAASRERTAETRANGLPRTRRVATVSGGGEGEWLRVDNAPVVFLSRDADPLDDEAVARQLDSKL